MTALSFWKGSAGGEGGGEGGGAGVQGAGRVVMQLMNRAPAAVNVTVVCGASSAVVRLASGPSITTLSWDHI